MGAWQFKTFSAGETIREAFNSAVEEAQWEDGHGGYTGTIAEKPGAVEVALPPDVDAQTFAELVVRHDAAPLYDLIGRMQTERVIQLNEDKWGPAIAVKAGEGKWLFFGLASC